MSEYGRRNVLKYAGLTAAIGAGVATNAVSAAESAVDESSTADGSGGWSSIRGDAGNTGFVPGASGPDSPVAVAWEYDHGGAFAVVGGTVYLAADDGQVRAIDAADGTLEWETEITTADGAETVAVMGSPAVAHETVYVTTKGKEPDLTALDAATGELRWQESDLGYETNLAPIVANELAFVVADKVLYALDAHSGERQWQFDPETVTTDDGQERGDSLRRESVAVANGTVFAVSNNRLFARDAETGDERWTARVDDWGSDTFSGRPIAADGVVAVVNSDTVVIYEADTGAQRSTVPSYALDVLADDHVYAVTEDDDERAVVTGYDAASGDRAWQPSDRADSFTSAVVDAESVYVGLEDSESSPGVVAFSRADGSREWRVDTDAKLRQVAVVDDTVYASGDSLFAIRTEGDGKENGGDNGDENSSDDTETESGDTETNEPGDTETNESGDGSDDTPGFTAGTSVAGGALVLEWLRRRTSTDE